VAVLRRPAPVIGLFLLTIGGLLIGVLLAPMYGGGAILVREIGRRYGVGMIWYTERFGMNRQGPASQFRMYAHFSG
jgi:hypothetical protein